MVFEIMGVNLLDIIKRYDYKGVPMHIARIMAKQILIGLDFLHRMCNLIHTDLKPENILICLTDDEIERISKSGMLTKKSKFLNNIKKFRNRNMVVVKEEDESFVFKQCIEKNKKESSKEKDNEE